jgi:short-subunit dehydrogenase
MSIWMVTGASRGLGRALCLRLAAEGHDVLALARDAARLRELAQHGTPGRILPCPLDLADGDALGPAIEDLLTRHPRIDGLINNAGIGSYRPFVEHTEAELRTLLQVNLMAPIQLCRALLPQMLARGAGQIINIGSDLGRRPLANMAAYVATKHGLTGFSHSLLREVKDSGVRVSLINPGIIDTDFGGGREGSRQASEALPVETLAALLMQLIGQPAQLIVDELSVHPVGQADF